MRSGSAPEAPRRRPRRAVAVLGPAVLALAALAPVPGATAAPVAAVGAAGPSGGASGAAAVALPPWSGYPQRLLQLPQGGSRYLRDVTVHGRVLGVVVAADDDVAVWDARGRPTVLPDPGRFADAAALDDRSRVVGRTQGEDRQWHAVVWTDGVPRVLEPPGAVASEALRVNRSGQVAGIAHTAAKESAAFLWSPATGVRYLTPFVPDDDLGTSLIGVAGLDDSGTVLGTIRWQADVTEDLPRAFRWTAAGGLLDLFAASRARGDVPYRVTGARLSESGLAAVSAELVDGRSAAWAVPPSGPPMDLVAGVATGRDRQFGVVHADARGRVLANTPWTASGCPSTATRGVIWEAGAGTRMLPTGTRCGETLAAGNDVGEVVGSFDPASVGIGSAFVWDERRGMRTLDRCQEVPPGEPFPPCPFSIAWALSDAGHVLGSGWKETGHLVWDPPEGVVRVVAPVVADTTVSASAPSRSFGEQPWVGGGGDAVGLLRVAVPAPPAGRSLVAATLHWWTTDLAGAGSATPLEARRVSGSWSSSTTWTTRPSVGTRRLGVVGVVGVGEPLSVRLDPADVPARGGALDLALVGAGPDGVRIGSREAADPRHRPVLELVYR